MDSTSSWQRRKSTARLPLRLSMRFFEAVVLAAAMFIVPTLMHRIVRSLDDVYELLGRRARSPYEQTVPWPSVIVASILLLGWHIWLGRLSYKTILESGDGAGGKDRVSWGRVLGRIIVPFLLLSLGAQFPWQVYARANIPAPIVVAP